MTDYLKLHTNQVSYDAWKASDSYVIPNVSLIEDINIVMYNPIPATPSSYNMLDILWSDGTATQTVRPTTDGVTPIGLCVAPTGFFGENEKARFMALKYAGGSSNGATVGNATGSTTYDNQFLQWTLQSAITDVAGLTNYSQFVSDNQNPYGQLADYQGSFIGGSCGCGCGGGEYIMLYTENNTWEGLEPNNTFTGYAIGDINGKQNTTAVSALGSLSNYPAFASVLNYYTPGTQAGDWYLPALGELAIICANQSRINTVLTSISSSYSSDCMSSIYVKYNYWSSTEYDSSCAFSIAFSLGGIDRAFSKVNGLIVIPMLIL